jgi:hypothetical protein
MKQLVKYKLLLLFLSLASIILLNSYFDPNGYLSPDSTYYLRLSKNLISNEGFKIADYNSPDGQSFFAIWPVGYPVMIFMMSKLTGLGVVWASKALNLLIIGVILLLFRYMFRGNAPWAGLIFFINANILIFSFTWSEVPFILFLLLISISLYKCVETSGKIVWLAGLFLTGIALFMMRYIGLISIGITGLIAVITFLRHRWLLSGKLLIIASLQIIFAALYLYNNKILTGYITGGLRALPRESNFVLLNQLFSALKEEAVFINRWKPLMISLGLLILLGIYLFSTRKKSHRDEKFDDLWKYFLFTGVIYLVAIVTIRWFSYITPLDFRFLAPGSFLIILSLAVYLQGKPSVKVMNSHILYLVILATLSINYIPNKYNMYKYVTTGTNYFQNQNYIENTRMILEKYKVVEPNSVVVFGSIHLRYLRENVIPTEIYGKSSLEDMMNYFTQKKDWNVYINIRDDLNPDFIHESFIRFMVNNKDKQIVKVR